MKITLKDLMKKHACYSEKKMLEISGGKTEMDLLDIMRLDISAEDRVWVACVCLPRKMRLEFAHTVASRALSRITNPDKRSVDALKVLRKYIDGKATKEELNAADAAAYAAAYATEKAAAAYAAAVAAARATYAADAAVAAAYAADAAAAAYAAAVAAAGAYAAAADAADAARVADAAAGADNAEAEREQQVEDIIKLLEGEE